MSIQSMWSYMSVSKVVRSAFTYKALHEPYCTHWRIKWDWAFIAIFFIIVSTFAVKVWAYCRRSLLSNLCISSPRIVPTTPGLSELRSLPHLSLNPFQTIDKTGRN